MNYNHKPHSTRLFLDIEHAVNIWLETLSPLTKKNYASGVKFLFKNNLLEPKIILKEFENIDHNEILLKIKNIKTTITGKHISEASKQARAACYISFTKFLYRLTKGYISQAIPSRDFSKPTFYKIRDKVKTNFISKTEWLLFFEALKKTSFRDYLVGKLIIQGVRKLCEVINLTTKDINFPKNQITFKIKKRKNREHKINVTYPNFLMKELYDYIQDREGSVFITDNGDTVTPNHIYYNFKLAETKSSLKVKVTPHVLRVSALVYLKKIGFSDSDIMKVSCLSSQAMILAYDFTLEDNISSQLPLIF